MFVGTPLTTITQTHNTRTTWAVMGEGATAHRVFQRENNRVEKRLLALRQSPHSLSASAAKSRPPRCKDTNDLIQDKHKAGRLRRRFMCLCEWTACQCFRRQTTQNTSCSLAVQMEHQHLKAPAINKDCLWAVAPPLGYICFFMHSALVYAGGYQGKSTWRHVQAEDEVTRLCAHPSY